MTNGDSSRSESEDELLFSGRRPKTAIKQAMRCPSIAGRRPANRAQRIPPARLTMMCYSSEEDLSDADSGSDGGVDLYKTASDTYEIGDNPSSSDKGEQVDKTSPGHYSNAGSSSGSDGNSKFDMTKPDEHGGGSMSKPYDGQYLYDEMTAYLQPQRALQATLVGNIVQLQEAIAAFSIQKDLLQAAISKPLPNDPTEVTELNAKEQLQLAVTTPLPMETISTGLKEDGRCNTPEAITDLRELAIREILHMMETASLPEDTGSKDNESCREDIHVARTIPLPEDPVGMWQYSTKFSRQMSRLRKVAILEKMREEEQYLRRAITTNLPDDNNISRADKVESILRLFSTGELHEALWDVGSFYRRNRKLFTEEGMNARPDYRRIAAGESVCNLREGLSRDEIATEMVRREDLASRRTSMKFYNHPNDYLGSEAFKELLKVRTLKAEGEDPGQVAASREEVDANPIKALAWATQDFGGRHETTEPQRHRMWLAQCGNPNIIAAAIEALERVRKWNGTNHYIGKSIARASPSGNMAKDKHTERANTSTGRLSRTFRDHKSHKANDSETNACNKRRGSGNGDHLKGEKKSKQNQIQAAPLIQPRRSTCACPAETMTTEQLSDSPQRIDTSPYGTKGTPATRRNKTYRGSPYARARDLRKKR
ncbi:MAG: hypothetical protein M1836_008146 [Candelina mexicana]|nr:MAG: hypothetical protein M1836_008146 [Candelina mexicana]